MSALPSLWWGWLLVPLAWMSRRRPLWLVPLFFVAGVVWVSFRAGLILQDELPHELEGRDLAVVGRIADIPETAEFGQRFEVDVMRAEIGGAAVHVPAHILLNSRDPLFHPHAGETWRLPVRLQCPHGYQNPGGFDYEGYLFQQRIRAKGYVRADAAPQRLNEGGAWFDIDRLRERLGACIRAQLPDNPYAGIVVALANGDSHGVTTEQWRVLRRTGTLHLIAISGLHISLVGGIVFFLGRWLWSLPGTTVLRLPAPMFGAICAMLAAVAYAALAGFVVPTQRALIMLAVAMSGVLRRRRFPPSQLLAMAALLVLLYDPLSVMAPGFWLSFAAVAVILYAMRDDGGAPWWRQWGYLQWAIALGMLPLMLALFQQASLVAPLANMIAVPVFDLLAVPLTLTGVVLLGVLPETAAGVSFKLVAALLHGLWQALMFLADHEFSQWVQPAPSPWALSCAVVGVALLLAPRGWPARWIGAVWMAPIILFQPATPAPGEAWFTLLDVGQGLAAVVRTSSHTLVFDAGPRFGDFDTGEAVVEPYLRAAGIRRLDTLVISHGDNDHIGGAESLMRALPVSAVLSSVPQRLPSARPCRAGDTWQWDEVEFAVLNPASAGDGPANDDSCVLSVRSRYGTALLPADIEAGAERRLIARWGERLRADILVAPHHGSNTSSTPAFIDAVAPRYVLFPAGYRSRYRHPHPGVVARYVKRGIVTRDSPAAGALEFHLRAAGLQESAYRVQHRRYWYADAGH
ncbi:MAG TPA: DNA internalization-related competence protein ComEC/Rec2 [Candidatus Methylomirabilis sp.]|nr:DNA internalization-related competence protein ComEC/Rec2 [Candidatus Methylomirabilis sp.]